MERLEIKSRVDAKLDEWKRHLDAMRVKVEGSEYDAKQDYRERVGELLREHEELRLRTARALESAAEDDARLDAVADDIEKALDAWERDAVRVRDDVLK